MTKLKREHAVGLLVVVALVGGFLWWRGKQLEKTEVLPAEGEGVEIEDKASEFAKRFGVVLPDNVERTELKDVTSGVGSGVATRSFSDSRFEHTVLAALADPETGSWYEGWLVREEPFDVLYTGKLRVAKGGFLLEYENGMDWRDHSKVVVTLEKVDDRKPEVHVLEGEFK